MVLIAKGNASSIPARKIIITGSKFQNGHPDAAVIVSPVVPVCDPFTSAPLA
jgi:hypothetical protein